MRTQPFDMLALVRLGIEHCRGEWTDLADESGVPWSSIRKIASGERPNPGVKPANRLYNALVKRGWIDHATGRFIAT